ncbi:hypothetical protein [Fictibacillus gelatini]|uniref:hypothetical protein n=1 Tax=Fictibacillus gelatini TaxID=225985 RepID=UPI00040DD7F1|nr:hypothetical protein [Fictibacillus gelatini]
MLPLIFVAGAVYCALGAVKAGKNIVRLNREIKNNTEFLRWIDEVKTQKKDAL